MTKDFCWPNNGLFLFIFTAARLLFLGRPEKKLEIVQVASLMPIVLLGSAGNGRQRCRIIQ